MWSPCDAQFCEKRAIRLSRQGSKGAVCENRSKLDGVSAIASDAINKPLAAAKHANIANRPSRPARAFARFADERSMNGPSVLECGKLYITDGVGAVEFISPS